MILPVDAQPYSRTAEFTEDTVPAALQKDHTTKEGVWGVIHVLEGRLVFRVTDERCGYSETVLGPGEPGVIAPTIRHHVQPLGSVRFFVEFLRRPDGA